MKEGINKFFVGASNTASETTELPIVEISANPFQPRQAFEQQPLDELAQSIKTYGLLQPILVRRHQGQYQLVAGERRLRACQQLGWTMIPAVIKEVNDSAMAAMALIENLQRENLDYFEEAEGFQRLLDEFGLTQEVLAQRIGKSQSTIANKMRLLKLEPDLRDKLMQAGLSERHARALLKLPDSASRQKVLDRIVKLNLNVRQAEGLIEGLLEDNKKKTKKAGKQGFVIKDYRIVMNTVRQAVASMEQIGLNPKITHAEKDDYFEVTIRLPK